MTATDLVLVLSTIWFTTFDEPMPSRLCNACDVCIIIYVQFIRIICTYVQRLKIKDVYVFYMLIKYMWNIIIIIWLGLNKIIILILIILRERCGYVCIYYYMCIIWFQHNNILYCMVLCFVHILRVCVYDKYLMNYLYYFLLKTIIKIIVWLQVCIVLIIQIRIRECIVSYYRSILKSPQKTILFEFTV